MDLRSLPNNSWLYRAVLATWIASAMIVTLLLTRIDTIVNVELYKYGSQFSYDWANPYWTCLRLNFIALGVPAALSLFAIAIGFVPKIKKVSENVAEHCNNKALKGARRPNAADISCPNCGKTFGRPIVMLDSEGGKSKLVNVCPYCNQVLGNTENGKSPGIDMQIADVDEKLAHESAQA